MIIVSNTSPLTNLAAIGQFSLLVRLYKEIHIANAVWSELIAGNQRWPGAEEVEASGCIYRHAIKNRVLAKALESDLDRGESESIVLALELIRWSKVKKSLPLDGGGVRVGVVTYRITTYYFPLPSIPSRQGRGKTTFDECIIIGFEFFVDGREGRPS